MFVSLHRRVCVGGAVLCLAVLNSLSLPMMKELQAPLNLGVCGSCDWRVMASPQLRDNHGHPKDRKKRYHFKGGLFGTVPEPSTLDQPKQWPHGPIMRPTGDAPHQNPQLPFSRPPSG